MTKQNILEVSSQLFFDHGIANVRLQQIADGTSISVGNLAYHYKNKEAIVEAIYQQAFVELHKLIDRSFKYSEFSDFDHFIQDFFHFNQSFGFCFNNAWEIARNYPGLNEEWLSSNKKILSQVQKRIHAYCNAGLLQAELYPGAYKLLAQQLLMNILSWLPQQQLSGKKVSLLPFRRNCWSLIYPYFTSKGVKAYHQVDGLG